MTTKETWKPVTIGGLTGILMGAGTMYAIQSTAANGNGEEASADEVLKVAHPSDDLSFSQAFDAAREEVGPGGVFRWHGHIYNTYTAEEWKAMSEQEHELFAQRVKPEISPADINTQQVAAAETAEVSNAEDVQIAANQESTAQHEDTQDDRQQVYANNQPEATATADEDGDVRVVGFGHVEVADGQYVAVEQVDINGQRVAIIDVDNDGVADIAMSDLNHNGVPDDGEIIDLHTGEAVAFTNNGNDSDDIHGQMAQDDTQPIDDGSDMISFTI